MLSSERQTDTTKITCYAASRVVKNIVVKNTTDKVHDDDDCLQQHSMGLRQPYL